VHTWEHIFFLAAVFNLVNVSEWRDPVGLEAKGPAPEKKQITSDCRPGPISFCLE